MNHSRHKVDILNYNLLVEILNISESFVYRVGLSINAKCLEPLMNESTSELVH